MFAGGTLRGDLSVLDVVRRLDASWYLDTARFGYAVQPATSEAVAADPAVLRGAFYPLWPLRARVTRPPGLSIEVSATVLATILGFGVVVASWLLVARLADRSAADRAAVLVAVFPGSFVLSIAYAEALMLCLVVLCLARAGGAAMVARRSARGAGDRDAAERDRAGGWLPVGGRRGDRAPARVATPPIVSG